MKRNIQVILLVFFILAVSFIWTSFSNSYASAEKALINLLKAYQEEDIEYYAQNVIDPWFSTKQEQIDNYLENIQIQKLIDFEIIDSKKMNSISYKFTLETSYSDGVIAQSPVMLKKLDGRWKILLDEELFDNEEYKVLQEKKEQNK